MSNTEIIIENAVKWAKARTESTQYALQCLRFVEDAVELSNNIEIFGGSSAKESADMYNVSEGAVVSCGEVTTGTGTPPKGAFVFYDCFGTINDKYENWGHVGLSLGDGNVIHTWDKVRIDNYLDVEKLQSAPGWTSPKFSGWVPIERVLARSRDKIWSE